MKKALIICPTGSAVQDPTHWRMAPQNPVYDVVVIKYSDYEETNPDVEVVRDKGMKWSLAKRYIEQNHDRVVRDYRYVGFLDDDLVITADSLKIMLNKAHDIGAALFQPATTQDSDCVYDVLKQQPGVDFTLTNFVEIMAPFVATSRLEELTGFWKEYEIDTGWGLDLILARLLGTYAHVFHSTPMIHPPKQQSMYNKEQAIREMGTCLALAQSRGITPITHPHVFSTRRLNG